MQWTQTENIAYSVAYLTIESTVADKQMRSFPL